MMRTLLALLLLASTAHARTPSSAHVLPQNQPLPATLAQINADKEDIATVGVMVNLGLGKENPTWAMTRTAKEVFLAKLLSDPTPTIFTTAEDRITMLAPSPEPAYKGLTLRLSRIDGKVFKEIRVYNGHINGTRGTLKRDLGRRLEYFIWGTARIKRESVMGARVMPVLNFDQCRMLAQQVVETTPRQCLLPDGDIILETTSVITKSALLNKDFASCLQHGVGLINTFPRRCVSPGGRVFAEPPQIYETPADAPLATSITNPMDPSLHTSSDHDMDIEVPADMLTSSTVITAPSPTQTVSVTLSTSETITRISAPATAALSTTVTSSSAPLVTLTPAVTSTLPAEVQTGLPARTLAEPSPTVTGLIASPTAFPTPAPLTNSFDSAPAPAQPTIPATPGPYAPTQTDLPSPPITVPASTPPSATGVAIPLPVLHNQVDPVPAR